MEKAQPTSPLSSKALEVIAPIAGLIYSALLILYFFVRFSLAPGGPPPFIVILGVFALAFVGAAVGVWRRSRAGYIAAVAVSALFLVTQGAETVEAWATPTATGRFVATITAVPVLAATLIYTLMGLRIVWRKNAPNSITRSMPRSGIVGLVAIGFILGGLVVGLMAGAVQTRLLTTSGGPADIGIVLGAGDPNNSEFYSPANFQAKVGQTVTWANRDPIAHTVTSVNGAFDSGNMDVGAVWSFTYTQPGTYEYICAYHPWMKGSVVVTG